MSYVDRLFPQAELEALGNRWHEPAPKRRKTDAGCAHSIEAASEAQRRQSVESGQYENTNARRRLARQPSRSGDATTRGTKRTKSEPQPLSTHVATTMIRDRNTAASNSCLPSFIEPSLLRNYLRHLHPKDSHRYAMNSYQPTESVIDEDEVSPGSLIPDSTPSPASTDNCPTPAAICEQFRSGPFGNIFDGMRLTDNERDLMEDLLSPEAGSQEDEPLEEMHEEGEAAVELGPDVQSDTDEQLLKKIFPSWAQVEHDAPEPARLLRTARPGETPSWSMVPAEDAVENDEKFPVHRGIVIYDYDAVSVDDFFDLDEAST